MNFRSIQRMRIGFVMVAIASCAGMLVAQERTGPPDNATFENPAHDYPKLIRYVLRPDGSLETVIAGAGGQRPQSFVLKRQP